MDENNQESKQKIYTPAILNRRWLGMCTEEVRNWKMDWEVRRTLLYLLWKERPGNCDCDADKSGNFCQGCGKRIRKAHAKSSSDIITAQLNK